MLYAQETFINRTQNARVGESDVFETFTDDRGKLYRSMRQEYGRCTGKVHIDPDAREIGWVFVKRTKYEDCDETYLQETWVTVHTAKPTRTTEYHYA